jgi:phosphate-selective porin OprO/OprP
VFGPVSVRRPLISHFSSKEHPEELGYGAFETTFRFSYLNFLNAQTPDGVKLIQPTIGMNWYLADRLRLMFNYTFAAPYQLATGTTTASEFGMRIGMYW